jgi:HPt (histidine-containing phosphotransfer) domain-containing protein
MSTEILEKYSVAIDTDDLMSRCFGNLDFVNRILNILKERCDAEIADLEQAARDLDVERVYSISHRLKGALANASASELSAVADKVCTSLASQNIGVTIDMIAQLRAGWNELSQLIEQDCKASG